MSRATSPLRDRLIFVVGARRSGTNWLQRVLTAHPDVVGVPSETYLFSHGLAPLVERFQHAAVGSARTGFVYMDPDELRDALRAFCDRVFDGIREALGPEAERICERTPDHVRHLDLMGELYPDGRFVHIVRDGRDVARSLRSQTWGPTSVEEAAAEWRSAIEAARRSAASLEHYHEVRYEELLGDPPSQVEQLFGHLGLPASEETVETALLEAGVRYNVDRRAPEVGAGKWAEAFDADELGRFYEVAADTLRELGYETPPAERAPRRAPRRITARIASRVRGLLPRGRSDAVDVDPLEQTQAAFHAFLEAIAARRWERLEGLLLPTAFVRLVGPHGAWEGRGEAAVDRLVEDLASDDALRGRQVRGDVYPAIPIFTLVAAYRTEDGGVHDRVLTVTAEGGRVSRIAYHRFPSGG